MKQPSAKLLHYYFFVLVINNSNPLHVTSAGHSIFASLAQMELLWHHEMKYIKIMENIVHNSTMEHPPLKM